MWLYAEGNIKTEDTVSVVEKERGGQGWWLRGKSVCHPAWWSEFDP